METRTAPTEPLVVRRRFASHLNGEGIEIGPGHVPFPVPPGVTVRYLDRWEPIVNSSLFAELGDTPGFPELDILADLDADRLAAVADSSQDFVIASHVLEHLANPLAMLVDIHRVLRPRGLLLLLLPDRHMTFDRERERTRLSHLVDEYHRDVREVDDAHILDFLIGTRGQVGDERDISIFTPELVADEIEIHRRRSVHAHVWDADEFAEVMDWAAVYLGVRWRVVDTMPPCGEGTYGNEFGWVLSRVGGDPSQAIAFQSRAIGNEAHGHPRPVNAIGAFNADRPASSQVCAENSRMVV